MTSQAYPSEVRTRKLAFPSWLVLGEDPEFSEAGGGGGGDLLVKHRIMDIIYKSDSCERGNYNKQQILESQNHGKPSKTMHHC